MVVDWKQANWDNVTFPSLTEEESYFPEKFKSKMSLTEDYVFAIYLACVGLATTIANILTLASFWSFRKLIKPIEFFIIFLSVTDLGVSFFAYALPSISGLKHRWIFGNIGCVWYAFNSYFFAVCGMTTITAMSVLRYLRHCHKQGVSRIGKKGVGMTIVVICLYSVFWSAAPLFGWGEYEVEPFGTSCTLNWKSPSKSYLISAFICVFFLPLLCIIYCYSRLAYSVTVTNATSTAHSKKDHHLNILVFLMVIVFVVTWTPYSVVTFIMAFDIAPTMSPLATSVPCAIAKLSTLLNPIVYFISIKRFRKALLKMLFNVRNEMQPKYLKVLLRKQEETGSTEQTADIENTRGDTQCEAPVTR